MKKLTTLTVVVTTILTLMTGCEKKSQQTTHKPNLKKIDFIIDWQPEATYIGIYYALDTKEFEKIGYDLKIQTSWGAHQAISAVASGKYSIGTASGGATVLARSNHAPIKSLGVLYNNTSTVIYGIASKSMAKKPKDIEGMKIGIYPESITTDEFQAFIKINHLDINKITKIALSGGDIPILMSKEVDGVLHYNEMSPDMVEVDTKLPKVNGKRTWRLHLKDYGIKSYGLNIITNDKAFLDNKDELLKITQAIYRGYKNGCNNIDDAVDKFTKRFPDKNKKYIKRGFETVCAQLENPIGKQTKEGWQSTINLFENLNLLKSPVKPDEIIAQ